MSKSQTKKFRTPYNITEPYPGITTPGGSRTHQSFKDECDINNIVRKAHQNGFFGHVSKAVPQFGDFTEVPDYQSALNMVIDAKQKFLEIPARIREKFDNDPNKFIEFVSNPANGDQLVAWGLATKREAAKPLDNAVPAPKSRKKTPSAPVEEAQSED